MDLHCKNNIVQKLMADKDNWRNISEKITRRHKYSGENYQAAQISGSKLPGGKNIPEKLTRRDKYPGENYQAA
jgi:hypothetical protein